VILLCSGRAGSFFSLDEKKQKSRLSSIELKVQKRPSAIQAAGYCCADLKSLIRFSGLLSFSSLGSFSKPSFKLS
jgi:hypothetical protein